MPEASSLDSAHSMSPQEETPAAVLASALAAFEERIEGAEIADIVHDSWLTESRDVVRLGPRFVRFACADLEIELAVVAGRSGALRLQLSPARQATIEVHRPGTAVMLKTDGNGVLVLDPAPMGVLCFVVRDAGRIIQSAWLRV